MKKTLKRIFILLTLFILTFSFIGCAGKEVNIDKVMKTVKQTETNIEKKFDYAEATIYKYNENGEKETKEVYLLHNADGKLYNAKYNIIRKTVNEDAGSEQIIESEALVYQYLIEKSNDKIYLIKDDNGLERDEISEDDYNRYMDLEYLVIFGNLLPTDSKLLILDKTEIGILNTVVAFKLSEDVPEINLKINSYTNKIHSARIYLTDGTYESRDYNYPMINGAINKTEIPKIA